MFMVSKITFLFNVEYYSTLIILAYEQDLNYKAKNEDLLPNVDLFRSTR